MKSIETEYAGYRFRSRLEARWAVFLDELGIEFDFEPEGFRVPLRYRQNWYPRGAFMSYLPDFWLPDLGLWAEAKGQFSARDHVKTLNGAVALSEAGQDVLIFGDTFRQPRGKSRRPWKLHFEEGELVATPWPRVEGVREVVASDHDPEAIADAVDLLRGYVGEETLPKEHLNAARAAQRARFEHGESG